MHACPCQLDTNLHNRECTCSTSLEESNTDTFEDTCAWITEVPARAPEAPMSGGTGNSTACALVRAPMACHVFRRRLATSAPRALVSTPTPRTRPALAELDTALFQKVVDDHLGLAQPPSTGLGPMTATPDAALAEKRPRVPKYDIHADDLAEADTERVPLGSKKSHWPGKDFEGVMSTMRTTLSRYLKIPRDNVRFRVELTPVPLTSKESVTSPARPTTPPAALVVTHISRQIANPKTSKDMMSKRGVSVLAREIFEAYGPHTGRRRYIKGLRIMLSGRLGGQERAASVYVTEGALALSSIDTYVDYESRPVNTRSGVVGIKVWIICEGGPLARRAPTTLAEAIEGRL